MSWPTKQENQTTNALNVPAVSVLLLQTGYCLQGGEGGGLAARGSGVLLLKT